MYENDKIKNVQIDYGSMMPAEYIIKDDKYYFSYEKVRELLAMACEDIYPNLHYGDVECCLWGEMRSILRKEGFTKTEPGYWEQ